MSQEGDYLLSVSPESLAKQPVDATTGENLHWTCDPTVELPIKISRDPKNNGSATPITTMNLMERNIAECPDFPALRVKRNGAWKTWTWAQYDQDVRRFARAAIRVGLQAHQCICIIGFNSPEWVIASIGAIFAGGISSGIYTTNGIEATHYVAAHSESVIAVAEDSEQVAKFLASRDRLPHLKQIVQYSGDILPENKKDGFVISWSDFLASGDIDAYPEGEQLLKQRIAAQRPGHCCSLIYTSGTTGKPKAVMLSHDNFTWTISYCLQEVNISRDERLISYLPLSHVAAQLVDIYGTLFSQGCLSFAMPDALKGTLVQTLQEVRPTIFVGVPRVWEKMEESMKAIGAAGGTFKQLLGTWAKNTGYRGSVAQIEGQDVPYGWTIADKLVFSNIKKALGLDKARYLATSAAPISKETLQYFMSLDMRLSEIFGMSECSGPHTLNTPINTRMFSVGRPFSGAEQRLATPGVLTSDPTSITNKEGELCIWGRHIFMGYLHAKEATMSTFEPNGYIRTGDIAKLDDDGYLYITGRIKELIITAGGENVAPVPIEDLIKAELPFLSNVMVVGDKRKFLTALLTVKTKPDNDMNPSREVTDLAISQLQGLGVKVENGITTADLCNNVEFKKVIDNGIERVNKKAVSAAQRVQKWKLIIDDFSVINGDLTPTMKLKRKVVHDKYIDIIEQLYEDAPTPIKSNL